MLVKPNTGAWVGLSWFHSEFGSIEQKEAPTFNSNFRLSRMFSFNPTYVLQLDLFVCDQLRAWRIVNRYFIAVTQGAACDRLLITRVLKF